TETAELTGTAEATATTERPSPPSDVELPRRSITLPTDLPMSVQIGDVTVLTDLIADALPSLAELSPDGNSVAWLVAEQARRPASLCVASLSNGGQNCLPVTGYSG